MAGRGIDQVLPHPSDPLLHEGYMSSALDYGPSREAMAWVSCLPAPSMACDVRGRYGLPTR
jgi:hypothetical protein